MYARESIHPKLEQLPQDKISKFFAEMRKESLVCLEKLFYDQFVCFYKFLLRHTFLHENMKNYP